MTQAKEGVYDRLNSYRDWPYMKVAVFCGSSAGHDAVYASETKRLGHFLGENNIDLVYGGGKTGLMGVVSDAVLEAGGRAFGVMPKYLVDKEIAHPGLTELSVVEDMHERKAKMAELADAFVALPGGAGTLEEIFEAWTWAQLGHHQKPCAFYNTQGFYDPLFEMITTMNEAGFLKDVFANMIIKTTEPDDLIAQFKVYQAPPQKWG
ncbi:TIGR00730 family Rossman fold protein [Litoribacillus peritrichatus]